MPSRFLFNIDLASSVNAPLVINFVGFVKFPVFYLNIIWVTKY
jgi:hypothetical protein